MLYAAYGSNMNRKQMKSRCPNSKIICNGKMYGWKLVFNIHLDIIETDDMNDEVPVVLWNIAKSDLSLLDVFEGCPKYYTKTTVLVETVYGDIVEAIVYVMTDNRKGISPPIREYYRRVLTGYKENGINTDILHDALVYSVYNETPYNQYYTREDGANGKDF